MLITRNLKIAGLFLLLLQALGAGAQEDSMFTSQPAGRGKYALVAYVNAGFGAYASNSGAPAYLNPDLTRLNPGATVRILWHPDHLLKVGLESGYVRFYKYRLRSESGKEGEVSLNAVPVLLAWSMSVTRNLNIFAGSGAYFLKTHLDYEGKTQATKFSVGWMAAASYIWPVGKASGIGAEAKWLYAAGTSNGTIGLQVQYVWKFAQW